jgi:putative flippase GtrA
MLLSTVILSILTDSSFGIPYAKIIATMAAASTQYAINTKFSLVLSQLK